MSDMRDFIKIVEGNGIKEQKFPVFYHGSYIKLPVGTILKPRGDAYEADWKDTDFYTILEKYRPVEMLSHKNAVFMCDNSDDVDIAGGATDWLFTVEPLGKIQRLLEKYNNKSLKINLKWDGCGL